MAKVTVTYKAWDHNEQVVPDSQKPEVWFRPLRTSLANGLMTDRAVQGTLDPVTGAGQVELESTEDVMYVPFMRWLVSGQDDTPNAARDYCEWDPFWPADGGPIQGLPGQVKLGGVWYGFGAPPQLLANRNDVIYLDITGPGVGVWVPARASFVEGVVV